MPEISRFFGIIIAMYYNDHEPPHFHAWYGGGSAMLEIETLAVMEGRLPPRVLELVVEWASLHRGELLNNWRAARAQTAMRGIRPLE